MDTVKFTPEFVLAAVNANMTKASKASDELLRLANIDYINSQTGLDVANEVKTYLTKAYELLDLVDIPETKATQFAIGAAITRQNTIIRNIELSL